ncbi:hypothetical protein TNCV_2640801 [Trichonephila clavipes]|nr:hypothetical protein TNCV_2640801 [Trichonephila clavipes]
MHIAGALRVVQGSFDLVVVVELFSAITLARNRTPKTIKLLFRDVKISSGSSPGYRPHHTYNQKVVPIGMCTANDLTENLRTFQVNAKLDNNLHQVQRWRNALFFACSSINLSIPIIQLAFRFQYA